MVAEIPYGGYWCTPFCKWQTSFSHLHSLKFAAYVAKNSLADKSIDPSIIDYGILGITVPQHKSFWGMPWIMSMIGDRHLGGLTVSEACATGARALSLTANQVELGKATCSLVITTDRTSNSPHVYYPSPVNTGGVGDHEDWTIDNFLNGDPSTDQYMTETAENVASRWEISTEAQHNLVLQRYEQYKMALANNKEFQAKYMKLPFDVPDAKFKKIIDTIDGDQGVYSVNADQLTVLDPVIPGKTVTYAGQTHPADATAGIFVTSSQKALEISTDRNIKITVTGCSDARAELAFMPHAPVLATKRLLRELDLSITDIDAVKSHNPFAVNDIVFALETGYPLEKMNNYGCSLIFGHPHAVTPIRQIIELIEELVHRGGGLGLFHGCAAGDMGIAVAITVDNR